MSDLTKRGDFVPFRVPLMVTMCAYLPMVKLAQVKRTQWRAVWKMRNLLV